jgi:hypothetical protein
MKSEHARLIGANPALLHGNVLDVIGTSIG